MNSFREQFGVAQAVAVEKQKEIDGLKKQNKKLEERMKLVLESVGGLSLLRIRSIL